MKLPTSPLGLMEFQQRTLEAAMREQNLIDQILGHGGHDIVDAWMKLRNQVPGPHAPALAWAKEFGKLIPGTFPTDVTDAALGIFDGSVAKALMGEREGLRATDLEREYAKLFAPTATEALFKEMERATSSYETIAGLSSRAPDLEQLWTEHAGQGELARAMTLATPWIDKIDPLRSFEAFGVATNVGQLVQAMSRGTGALGDLDSILGGWYPPADFFRWDEPSRLLAYQSVGVDMRIFDIPAFAYAQVAREVGIAPSRRPYLPTNKSQHAPRRADSLNAAAGQQVKRIELLMRAEIARRGEVVFGAGWTLVLIPPRVMKRLLKVQSERKVGRSPAILDHSYFSDLVEIIAQEGVWEKLFSDVELPRSEFELAVRYCVDTRNALSHYVPIDQREFTLVCSAAARLMAVFVGNTDAETKH